MSVKLSLKKMGIPVPEIARGVNPHETIRQSMFTLCGPVLTQDLELAGNHRLVILDPVNGMPAFVPLSGQTSMEDFTELLNQLDPGHDYGDTDSSSDAPAEGSKQEATPEEQTTQKAALEALSDSLSPKVMVQDGETLRPVNMTDAEDPHADWYYVLDTTKAGTSADPIVFVLNEGQKQVAEAEVRTTQQTALNAMISALVPVLPKIKDGDTVRDAVIDDATAENNDWYYKLDLGSHAGTSDDPVEFDLAPAPAGDSTLQKRFDWLFNRIFVVRAGSEFAEMMLLTALSEYDTLDAAHDTCCRLEKGRISNLCVLPLSDFVPAEGKLTMEAMAEAVVPGEAASFFVKEDGSDVTLAPVSFAKANCFFESGWTEVKAPSIVVNNAMVKQSVDKDGVVHYNLYIDITCC